MAKSKVRNIILVAGAAAVIFGFGIGSLIKPADEYSESERRILAQKPSINAEALSSGQFMKDFENYSLDQFPFRDAFRSLKAYTSKYILNQKDNNGYYIVDGYLSKLEYPLNETRFDTNIQKLQEVYNKYLANTDCDIYLSMIPDKNYFLAPLGNYPALDYDAITQKMTDSLSFAEYIPIFDYLSLDAYYRTDQHWREEKILPVANALADGLGISILQDYIDVKADVDFYGTYYGQAGIKMAPDDIHYLTNDVLDNCIVTSYDTGKPKEASIYNMKKLNGKDPYEMFLGGSDALITIENPNADTDRELIIFRDSFGSSITPLLASGYSKITLVDLRYINSNYLGNFIEFKNQDVLILYSTLILNNTIYN